MKALPLPGGAEKITASGGFAMKRNKLIRKKILCALLLAGMLCLLTACSRVANIKLPPLPTPKPAEPEPTVEVLVTAVPDASPLPQGLFPKPDTGALPTPPPAPVLTPMPTPIPTPVPTPEPTPEPVYENPDIPHLYIENATYPESMAQYGVADLLGEIYTDKGVIAQVCGRIYNNDSGQNEQICMYYPYEQYFSLGGTVNANLIFGMLEPGHYTYIVSAIAENNSYSSGETVLIEHAFEIYYP
jgi:hypothetical protein